METPIEKPFKCNTCSARFTNEDHLQVHSRRHEMSLNLGGGLRLPEGFVDETPTPTHLCKNLEEVGLFQDLQNINPFDAEFAKAASATPSSENNFEFNFSFPKVDPSQAVPIPSHTTSNNDTLNTPQIPGYPPTTPLPHQSLTSSGQVENRKVLTPTQETQEPIGTGINSSRETVVYESKTTKTIITLLVPDSVGGSTKSATSDSSGTGKTKSHLRLTVNSSPVNVNLIPSSTELEAGSPDKKADMLERNRAAASRSRERRKQWVSGLEAKCQSLQTILSKVQAELNKVRTENILLKDELSRHANCNVTRSSAPSPVSVSTIFSKISPTFQPAILLRQGSVLGTGAPSETLTQLEVGTSRSVKPKRGRPRKGQERRVPVQLPVTTLSSDGFDPPPFKIQILPLSALAKPSASQGPIFCTIAETELS